MAEDFKVLLGVELKPDALTDIQDDINKIQNKINPIQVRLDDRLISQDVADITQQINGIRQTNPITIQLDRTSLQNVSRQIDGIRQQIQDLGNIRIDFGGGNNPRGVGSTVTAIQRAFRQTSDLYKQIKSMEQKVRDLGASGLDADNITLYNQQLNALRNTYNDLVYALSGQNVNLDLVFNDINNARTAIATLSSVVDNVRTKLASDIKIKINNGSLNDQIRTVEQSFDNLNIANDDVRNGIAELQRLLGTMDASDNIEYVTAQYQIFKQVLIEVTNQVKELQRQQGQQQQQQQSQLRLQQQAIREQRREQQNKSLEASKKNLIYSAEVWLNDHSAAARKFGSEIDNLIVKIRACNNAGDLSILRKSLQDIQKQARLAGNDTKSLGDRLKKQFSEYSTYFSVASLMNYAEQAIRSMYNNVIELDSAMTDLMKVTNETTGAYDRFLSSAGKSAQELGRSTSSFVQQSANWAKMGFDTVDSAKLAKISSIYSNVADVDDATAVSDIVTAMKAFNIEAKNAITIIDPMNKISNEFAVTAAGLGQGLSRAASTMATAGTDLEHTLALLTGIAEITQSPEEAGNFLKTAIARIQGMKGVLEELGEEVDSSVNSISKVQTQILNLTHGEVNIFDDSGNFRDYYYIMQDIADIVDELKSTERAQLYEILFGKNRMNQGAAMIQAFQSGRIEKALGAALGSEGSAYAEQEKWMESLEAKLGKLQAAWQGLSSSFLESNFLKGLIDGITKLVNGLDLVVKKAGTLPTIFASLSAGVSLFKNKGLFTFDKDNKQISLMNINLSNLVGNYNKVITACNTYNSNLNKSTGLQNAYINAIGNQNSSLGKYLSGLNGAKASFKGYIASLTGAKVASVGLQVATIALNTAITMGLSVAITMLANGISKLINSEENARDAAIEAGDAAIDNANNIYDLVTAYFELKDAVKEGAGSSKDLIDAQNSIISALDLTGESVDELIAKYGDLKTAILSASSAQFETDISNSVSSANAAKDKAADEMDKGPIGSDQYYATGEYVEEILNKLIEHGYSGITVGTNGGSIMVPNGIHNISTPSFEELLENYKYLDEVRNFILENAKDGAENEIFKILTKQYNEYAEYIDPALTKIEEANKLIAKKIVIDKQVEGVPKTLEEYEVVRQDIINKLQSNVNFDEAYGTFSAEAIVDRVLTENEAFDEIAAQYNEQKVYLAEMAQKRKVILESIFGEGAENYAPIDEMSDKEINIAYKLVTEADYSSLEDLKADIKSKLSGEKLSLKDLLIDDTKSDDDYIDLINNYIEEAEYFKDVLDKIRNDTLGDSEKTELFFKYPDISDAENLETAVIDLINKTKGAYDELTGESYGVIGVFNEMFNALDQTPENVSKFLAIQKAVENLFDTTEKGVISFDNYYDAIDKVTNVSSLMKNAQKELAETGANSINTIDSLYSIFGENASQYYAIGEEGIIVNVEKIRNDYIAAINDITEFSQDEKDVLIDNLDFINEYSFNALSDAMEKASDISSIAANSQKEIAYDTIESLRDIFGDNFEDYIVKDENGNYLKTNTDALYEYANGLLVANNATSSIIASFDKMWQDALNGSDEALTSFEKISNAINLVSNVSDYLTNVGSDDFGYLEALEQANDLLNNMPDGYSFDDFFTFEDGKVVYNTEFLTQWINGYIDSMVEAGDITSETAIQMKEAAKAEKEIVDVSQELSDVMNKVDKGSDLISNAMKEIEDSGENSLKTYQDLYDLFGEEAEQFITYIDSDSFVIDYSGIREKLYDIIDSMEFLTPAIKQSMKNALNVQLDDESFNKSVDNYVDKITTLQNALEKIRSGEGLSNTEKYDLVNEFRELAGETDNLEEGIINLINSLNSDMASQFNGQLEKVDSDKARKELESFMEITLALGEVVGDTQFSIDFEAETEGMDNFFSAVKESVSATGLASESIKSLKARYQDLEEYDPTRLFERTENGIHLNTKALRELESAYEKQTKLKLDKELDDYVKQYNDLTKEIDKTSDASKRADLYAQRDNIRNQINDAANLIAQYEGLTSAFYKWQQAQSMGEEGDMYDSLAGGLENIKQLYDDGLIGTNKFRTAVQLMSNEDLSTASIDKLLAAYEAGYPKMQRYFTDSEKGCLNFLNDVQALNSEWVHMNEDGSWDIDFGVGGDQDIADALGINVEAVQSILKKLSDYGFDVNLDSATTSIEGLKKTIEETEAELIKLCGEDYEVSCNINCDDNEIQTEIDKVKERLKGLEDKPTSARVEAEIADAEARLDYLIQRKIELENPAFMQINVSDIDDTEIQNALTLLQEYQTAVNNLKALEIKGADTTEAKAKVDELAASIQALPEETKTKVGLQDDGTIESIKAQIANDEVKIPVKGEVTGTEDVNLLKEALDSLKSKFVTAVAAVFGTKLVNNLASAIEGLKNKTVTITTIHRDVYTSGKSSSGSGIKNNYNTPTMLAKVNGTAFSHGTFGKAFKQGDWSIKDSGVALGGELGQEIVVRDGRYFTIGDNGAEFFNYKRGDIIFNHKQTEELFKYGKITSNNGRGKAIASGTAFVEGRAFSDANGSMIIGGKVVTTPSNGSSSSDSDDEDEFKEKFDWIEIAIDRIERAISSLDLKANSVYKSWSSRNENLKKEISEIGNEITLQQSGYERYMQEANSVGLSESWAKLVRDGTIDISTITDEDLAEKINEYSDWYNKAIDCRDAVEELKETESELYQQAFDNIVTQYEGMLSAIEYEKNMLDEYIAQSEAKGYIASTSYYEALIKAEKSNIDQLEKEKDALYNSMQEAVNSGAIVEGSEAFNEMRDQINEVNLAIAEANTSLIEYNNSIRDIEWQVFDLLQEKISQITQEGDFLIDLLSNEELYDDKGQLTNYGMSTMGLYGMNYNVYMEKASKYAQELLDIEKDIANDPYNQTLIERKQELLELQQESILAAEDEKQAIVDMVKEGIELELDALTELIDKYKDALDAEKDLYDYQKKIEEKTKEIAVLEKQMSAYQGDNSEEVRAKVQEIKVSLEKAKDDLEETEYDKYISDQKQLFDDLYTEYETVLNMRLDNIDSLISDVITAINDNASIINETLSDKSSSVGYSQTETIGSIWNGSTGSDVVTSYGSGTADSATTIGGVINSFTDGVQDMTDALDSKANENINYTNNSSGSNENYKSSYTSDQNNKTSSSNKATSSSKSSSSSKSTSKSSSSSSNTKSTSSNSDGNVFDYKKDSYPKDQLDVNKSVVDRLKYNNFDSSFSARSDYYSELGFSGTYTGSEEQNIKMLDYLKKNGYKQGKYRLSRNELAWTQEGKDLEAIIRPSDGAILTPLARNDSVLKSSATSNIFNFANDPSKFIRDNLNIANSVTNNPSKNIAGNTYDNDFSIQIELPNVTNYEQFKYAMQHDKSFEKMVRAMTVDKMFGGSSLKKYNY